MSEAPAVSAPTTAPAPASSLYAPDGGAAAAAALPGADTTAAAADEDTIAAAFGEDTVAAAAGADTVTAPAGEDTIAATTYEFSLPEGLLADAALTTEAQSVFAAAGVPADKAQSLIDLFGKAVKASTDSQATAHAAEQTAWITEVNSMPEFSGPTKEKSLASIGKLFDEFGTPEARAALNSHGIGNNPALVKMMLKIASTLSEGAPTAQGGPVGESRGRQPKSVGQSLYGSTT